MNLNNCEDDRRRLPVNADMDHYTANKDGLLALNDRVLALLNQASPEERKFYKDYQPDDRPERTFHSPDLLSEPPLPGSALHSAP